ncbi:MAG TPA: Do family serine endopeptidase [Terracidiphilus sp.]|jgi:serine protease Do
MKHSTNELVTAKKLAIPAAIVGAFVLGAALFVGHGNVHAATAIDDNSVEALTSLDRAMEAVAARVTPAVVNVAVTSRGTGEDDTSQGQSQGGQMQGLPPGLQQFFFGQGQQQPSQQIEHGVGSGIIISPDGYIVTNHHVVDGATNIKVTLNDRRILNAKVVGIDKLNDLAVLKVNATNLPSIAWGDSTKLEPGQTVLAFGSPFGYFQFSVTRGIVSAVNRPNPYSDDPRKPGDFIQTDAAINPGNSGGALVNAHGELVGINTFIITNSGSFAGAGFAIPSQIVRASAEQLIKNGKVEHGYLGISMNDVTPENAHFFNLENATGAIVSQVTPDSPASRGGLKTGDVITRVNQTTVVNGSTLQVAVSEMEPGTKISLGVIRNGKPVTLDLTVGQFHGNSEVASNDSSDGQGGANTGKLGLAVSNLTADTRQQINAPDQIRGVVVQSVRPASPADDAGLQPGDVILEINRKPAESASQFANEVHQDENGKDILLLVWSKGNASYRTIHPDQDQSNG